MSILSRLTRLAVNTAQAAAGEDVSYEYDVTIGPNAVYVNDDSFTVTLVTEDSSGTGKLQRSSTSSGPWTDVIDLDDPDFPIATIEHTDPAFYRITSASSDTELKWVYSVAITDAVRARQSWQIEDPGSNRLRSQERIQHWIIESEQLVDSEGASHEPERSDRIVSGNQTYYVIPETPNGALWRYVNRQGKSHFRIFTRERS